MTYSTTGLGHGRGQGTREHGNRQPRATETTDDHKIGKIGKSQWSAVRQWIHYIATLVCGHNPAWCFSRISGSTGHQQMCLAVVWWDTCRLDYLHAVLSSAPIRWIPLRPCATDSFSTFGSGLYSYLTTRDSSTCVAHRTVERMEAYWLRVAHTPFVVDAECTRRAAILCTFKHGTIGTSIAKLSRQF